MEEAMVERIYDTLARSLLPRFRAPGVERAFEEGSFCYKRYGDMLQAYEKLCVRLGVADEDDDVQEMISAFLDIQYELCKKMYQYGAEFGNG